MALEHGMQQAISLAHRPQEDEALQRKLWLAIAHHLIRSTASDQHPVRLPVPTVFGKISPTPKKQGSAALQRGCNLHRAAAVTEIVLDNMALNPAAD